MTPLQILENFFAGQPKELSLDTETTGLTWKDKAFMISYAWYEQSELHSGYLDLRTDNDSYLRFLKYLEDERPNIVYHNAKFDMHKLNFYPIEFDDTCLMIYLLNEHHVKGLKPAAAKILKESTDEDEVLKLKRRELKLKKSDGYGPIPIDVLAPYAIKDAEFTLRLYAKLKDALEKVPTVNAVYALEKQLILDVCTIERNGLKVDVEYCRNKTRTMGDETWKIEQRIAELVNKPVGTAPGEFNPRSPQQLMNIFDAMGIVIPSTGISELRNVDHELAKLIVEMRSLNKLRSTYLIPMVEEQENGILHPNFNLNRTVTKRFSSSGANE